MSEIQGHRVLTYDHDEPALGSERAATDLIGDAFGEQADVVVVPADRVAADFYTLSTRVAGDVMRKFQMYHVRLVIVGDVTAHEEASEAFRAFVHEINRGSDIWFVRDEQELSAKLA